MNMYMKEKFLSSDLLLNIDILSKYKIVTLVAQLVKNLPAVRETWVRSLGWENPLEKGTATHSSILAWEIPWTDELGGLQSRILEWVSVPSSRGISQPRDRTQVSCIAGRFFTV